MKLKIDEDEYVLDDDTLGFIVSKIRLMITDGYGKVNETLKFALKAFTRKLLYDYETKFGTELAGYPTRPCKNCDPTIHLFDLVLHLLREASDNATITVKSENTDTSERTITSISISASNKD